MSPSSSAIRAKALEIGFDLCGIAPVEGFPELSFITEWLARGYAGDMAWMTRTADKRADVRHVVPGARSVIVTGTLYNTDRPYSSDLSPDIAHISRYAWGDDYHDVLKQRLDALLEWMRGESDEPFDARAYVDTGPVQERVYAQYAGLGWIGKNTCLINPEWGSWLFLGEIISTLPLEADTQGLEQCGNCTRCLEACPTGALVEPGVLDSNRCLSYLTIELRTAIPDEHRRALGSQARRDRGQRDSGGAWHAGRRQGSPFASQNQYRSGHRGCEDGRLWRHRRDRPGALPGSPRLQRRRWQSRRQG